MQITGRLKAIAWFTRGDSPDPNTGKYLKTTAESAEAAEIAERDLSVHLNLAHAPL
jgi:hypothetical protein